MTPTPEANRNEPPPGVPDWLEELAADSTPEGLEDEAERMIRAGYAVTRIDWIGLKEASREAFQQAGNVVAAERAALAGLAAQGLDQYAEVVSPVDKGATKIRLTLTREAEAIRRKIAEGNQP